jgi:hypothetical protein
MEYAIKFENLSLSAGKDRVLVEINEDTFELPYPQGQQLLERVGHFVLEELASSKDVSAIEIQLPD